MIDEGAYGTDEAILLKDEGEEGGQVFGPAWHRLKDGKMKKVGSTDWITEAEAEQIARSFGVPLYYT